MKYNIDKNVYKIPKSLRVVATTIMSQFVQYARYPRVIKSEELEDLGLVEDVEDVDLADLLEISSSYLKTTWFSNPTHTLVDERLRKASVLRVTPGFSVLVLFLCPPSP